jgi:hypothetical protein
VSWSASCLPSNTSHVSPSATAWAQMAGLRDNPTVSAGGFSVHPHGKRCESLKGGPIESCKRRCDHYRPVNGSALLIACDEPMPRPSSPPPWEALYHVAPALLAGRRVLSARVVSRPSLHAHHRDEATVRGCLSLPHLPTYTAPMGSARQSADWRGQMRAIMGEAQAI